MPPRKSDHRKSDVSVARFALKDGLPEASPPSAPPSATPAAADTTTVSVSASTAPAPPPSTSASAPDNTTHDASQDKKESRDKDATAIEDLTLPKSIITRLAKGVLPANTQIQANAVLAMSKSTTVFVNHLASYANEHTTSAGKKTIAPADVFKALDDIEFGFLRERLEAEFAKFNAIQTEKRTSYRNKVKAAKQDPNASTVGDVSMADTTLASADNSTLTAADRNDGPAGSSSSSSAAAAAAGPDAPRTKKQRVDEEHDDAETEDEHPLDEDEDMHDDDDEDDDDVDEDEDDEDDERGQGSGDETQDALEERDALGQERDEALDGDDSD
ncbi:hypothetical protein ACO1O0_000422 [Amphichorda felina]